MGRAPVAPALLDARKVEMENQTGKEVLLAQPRGFCAGVDRAIEIVERALIEFGAPIYVRHEIVHNAYVVDDLRRKGAIFIEELADVPAGTGSLAADTVASIWSTSASGSWRRPASRSR